MTEVTWGQDARLPCLPGCGPAWHMQHNCVKLHDCGAYGVHPTMTASIPLVTLSAALLEDTVLSTHPMPDKRLPCHSLCSPY